MSEEMDMNMNMNMDMENIDPNKAKQMVSSGKINQNINMENIEPNKTQQAVTEISSGETSNEASVSPEIESIAESEGDSDKLDKIFHTAEEQRELFLWKYPDVSKEEVKKMYNQFKAADVYNRGELTEHEAMMMFEKRGSSKTASELRQMVSHGDKDKSFRLSLSEWLCAEFNKSYEQLTLTDKQARRKALAEAKAAREEAARLEESIRQMQEEWDHRSSQRVQALEEEARQSVLAQEGVAGIRAMFSRSSEKVTCTKSVEEQVKEEYQQRKAMKQALLDAKQKMAAAVEEANRKMQTAEEIAREVKAANERRAQEEAEEARRKVDAEKAERAARKAALNAKWASALKTGEADGQAV